MKAFPKKIIRAFSLVEVVISLAVVSIGVISILGLFGVAFDSVRGVTNQSEANSVAKALPGYFQTVGFTNLYTTIQGGGLSGNSAVYAYTATNAASPYVPTMVLDTNNGPNMQTGQIATRTGRIFEVCLTFSPNNVPINTTANGTPVYKATLPSSPDPSTGYMNSYLPINVKIYAVPQVPYTVPANISPVLNYDSILSR